MPAQSTAPIIIRKKIAHAAHHGGAWKVAYADFVTAMMALFIVLWLLNSTQSVKDAVGGYFRDPEGNGKQVGTMKDGTGPRVKGPEVVMKVLKDRLEAAIQLMPHFNSLKANVEVTITQEGLRIELLENEKGLFFESGSSELSETGVDILKALAKELGAIPNQILVEGHTDAAPYLPNLAYSNWELSCDRANQARRVLMASGLKADQISQVRGFADQDLRNKLNPRDPANRRISLLVKNLDESAKLKLDTKPGAVSGAGHGVSPPRVAYSNAVD